MKTIKIKKEHYDTLNNYLEQSKDFEVSMRMIMKWLRKNEEMLWKVIDDFYPEVSDYEKKIDFKKMEITALKKK